MTVELKNAETDEASLKMPSKRSIIRRAFVIFELFGRIVWAVFVKFWRLCTTGLLIVVLLFCIYGGVLAFLCLVLGILGLMYHAQDMLLYHPEVPPDSRFYVLLPSAFHLPFENLTISTRDGLKINAYWIRQPQPGGPTLLYFHGNAGNIGHRLQNVLGLYTACGFSVILVEYRGYGRSEGTPSEHGLCLDAEAAMDFILKRNDINLRQLFVFGRSLGGAVAVSLAASPYYAQNIAGLILENTFTSIPDIGRHIFHLSLLGYIPHWCYKNLFPSLDRISKVKLPILFISGLKDDLVPPTMMRTLCAQTGSIKKHFQVYPEGTHNETWMCQGYYEALSSFVIEVLQAGNGMDPSHHLESKFQDSQQASIDFSGYTAI